MLHDLYVREETIKVEEVDFCFNLIDTVIKGTKMHLEKDVGGPEHQVIKNFKWPNQLTDQISQMNLVNT